MAAPSKTPQQCRHVPLNFILLQLNIMKHLSEKQAVTVPGMYNIINLLDHAHDNHTVSFVFLL